jgi:hypothetical protein
MLLSIPLTCITSAQGLFFRHWVGAVEMRVVQLQKYPCHSCTSILPHVRIFPHIASPRCEDVIIISFPFSSSPCSYPQPSPPQ